MQVPPDPAAAPPALVGVADAEAARERIAGIVRPTPVVRVDALCRLSGAEVRLKCEHTQRTGSFKIRGAMNLLAQLPPGAEVVAASAGNHAQGVALAAACVGARAEVFMPATAPLPKLDATRDYGAAVQLVDGGVDACIEAAKAHAAATGRTFVPPFDHPEVIAGQATIGLELADELGDDVRHVLVPVGGGGLLAGIAAVLAERRPDIAVWGVEAVGCASMQASLAAGAPVTVAHARTIADGIAVKAPSALTLAHAQAFCAGVVAVSDEATTRAVLALAERAKAVVEPAGAVGLAAVLEDRSRFDGPVCAVLSGGNVDPLLLAKLIDHGLTIGGRYLNLTVVMPDAPGSLAELTAVVAEMGLNVVTVEHHRSGVLLPVTAVEVVMGVETRNPAHQRAVVAELVARGFDVRDVAV